MNAARSKKLSVEVDVDVVAKLARAANALSGVAAAYIHGCDDPRVRVLGKAAKAASAR
jgi:hypothetical protein